MIGDRRPLEFSRDGGKTWEVVGWIDQHSLSITLDGLTLGLDSAEPARPPIAWVEVGTGRAVVKMTASCSQNDSPP